MSAHIDFSFIIPTRDRPGQLAVCLESIARLQCDRPYEVIVVDDGGTSPLDGVVERFCDLLDITLLTQENSGPAAARNAGAARATGRFLAFTDDDCTPAENWLGVVAARLDTVPDHAVGGFTVNALPDDRCAAASQHLINYLYEYYNADREDARFFTSNNLAVPAKGFHDLGGFDPRFPRAAGEDRDFCDRWRKAGLRMLYAPEAIVHHRHHMGLRKFWFQHFNYGRGACRFHRERSRRSGEQLRFEPVRFYANLMRYGFRDDRGGWSPRLGALLMLSQVGNTAGVLWETVRQPHPAPGKGTERAEGSR